MIYENESDRQQQALAAHQWEAHMRRLGATQIRPIETPEHRRECYDFEIREGESGQYWTGVIEVKSRRVYSTQIEEWGSIVVELERLKSLKRLFFKAGLGGKKRWDKNVVFLFRCVHDDVCYAISIETIIKHFHEFEPAPAHMLKEDHGEGEKDCSGVLVPVHLMERFL